LKLLSTRVRAREVKSREWKRLAARWVEGYAAQRMARGKAGQSEEVET